MRLCPHGSELPAQLGLLQIAYRIPLSIDFEIGFFGWIQPSSYLRKVACLRKKANVASQICVLERILGNGKIPCTQYHDAEDTILRCFTVCVSIEVCFMACCEHVTCILSVSVE